MSHTYMSHTSFESQYSDLIQSEERCDDWPPGGAREPIEKNTRNRYIAPPHGRFMKFFINIIITS